MSASSAVEESPNSGSVISYQRFKSANRRPARLVRALSLATSASERVTMRCARRAQHETQRLVQPGQVVVVESNELVTTEAHGAAFCELQMKRRVRLPFLDLGAWWLRAGILGSRARWASAAAGNWAVGAAAVVSSADVTDRHRATAPTRVALPMTPRMVVRPSAAPTGGGAATHTSQPRVVV